MRGGADSSGVDGLGLLMSIKGPAMALRLILKREPPIRELAEFIFISDIAPAGAEKSS
jgi:hypothetical protein